MEANMSSNFFSLSFFSLFFPSGTFIYDINFIMDGNPSARNKLFFILNNWWKAKLLDKSLSDAFLFQSVCMVGRCFFLFLIFFFLLFFLSC